MLSAASLTRKLGTLTLVTVLAACGGDSPTDPAGTQQQDQQVSIVGTWKLQSVNNAALPYDLGTFEGMHSEILSEVYVLNANGTMSQTTTVRVTDAGGATTMPLDRLGTWVLNGSAISIAETGDIPRSGSVSGNTFTLNVAGKAFMYKKQ